MSQGLDACFSGRGTLLIRCVEDWLAAGHTLSAVLSDDDAVCRWAERAGHTLNSTAPFETDCLFAIGLPLETVRSGPARVRRHAIGFQDANLPAYAGWYATTWALLRGETRHGVTWYTQTDRTMEPVARLEFDIPPGATAYSLDTQCFDAGLKSFHDLMPLLAHERLPVLPEREVERSYFPESRRPNGAGLLFFSKPTAELLALGRALNFGMRPNFLTRVKVWTGRAVLAVSEVEAAENPEGLLSGSVLHTDAHTVTIATVDGAVRLHGLTLLEGVPIDPRAYFVAEEGGVLRVPVFEMDRTRPIAAAHELLVATEAEWVKRLEVLEPFAWPFAVGTRTGRATFKRTFVDLPGLSDVLEDRAALVASFFARLSDAKTLDLGWRTDVFSTGQPLNQMLADVVPFPVRLEASTSWGEFSEASVDTLHRLLELKTYPRDILSRYHSLRHVGAVRYPVCLAESDEALADVDADLVVVLGGEDEGVAWHYDTQVLSAERVAQLTALFVQWVEGLAAETERPLRQRSLATAPSLLEGDALELPGGNDLVGRVDAGGVDVLSEVLNILEELSGIERETLDPNTTFLEMGFDSLSLARVSLAFQKKFLVKLTLRQMLDDYSSPSAIAGYIREHMPEKARGSGGAVPPAVGVSATPVSSSSAPTQAFSQSGSFAPEVEGEKKAARPVLTRRGPYAPINTSAGDALTAKQQKHLDALIARYTKKTQRSKEHARLHRGQVADPGAAAESRATWKELTYPIVAARSAGSKIWDLDGNEFLDVMMGFGTNLFGHNPEFVRVALEKQVATGLETGPQSALAGEIAQAIAAMTGMDRVMFCNAGSEAVMGAVRAARTVTGRDRIVYFSGDYHGVNDEALAKGQPFRGQMRTAPIAPGIPQDLASHVDALTYGDPAALDVIRAEANSIAAILVEPVQSRKPQSQSREFLHALRALTQELGIALIFDEVVTGFRIHPGGAQAWFGVHADLTAYGEIISGGMPMGVIAGRRVYMDALDAGTWNYSDHLLAMALSRAVVKHLQEAGPGLQSDLNERTTRFVERANEIFTGEGVALHIHNFGSLWYFSHGNSFKHFSLLFHFLRDQGIHIWEGRPCFLSTAHSDADIDRLVEAFRQALAAMREGDFLPEARVEIPESGPFALTPGQYEIWVAAALDASASPAFNVSCAFTFRGAFDRGAMERALQQLVARHEALRTTFDADGALQRVHPSGRMDVAFVDVSRFSDAEREAELVAVIEQEVSHVFDLTALPLARARLVRMQDDVHMLLLTVHHIVCDGWSCDVMMRDLGALYTAAASGVADTRPLPVQFRAYARYLQAYWQDGRAEEDLRYWSKTLAHPPDAIAWPLERDRPPARTFRGAMEVATLDASLMAALRDVGQRHRATLFVNLLAHHAVLLHRLTGQTDLVIGVPAAGQQLMEDGTLIGHCANLLPIRVTVESGQRFSEVLAATQRALLDAYEHLGLTFSDILPALQIPRDPLRPPLVQTTFNVSHAIHGMQFGELATEEAVINPPTAVQFEQSLNVVPSDAGLRVEYYYNTDLFDVETIRRWLGYFRAIAEAVVDDPQVQVGAIPLVGREEREKLLVAWNATQSAYPAKCVHELFEEVAAEGPERVALSLEGRTMTYAELDAASNRLARALLAQGVRPDQAVGLCAERSFEMVVGVLGILKAGGAYMPLDPTHPVERLALQIQDAETGVVVAMAQYRGLFGDANVRVVVLDGEDATWTAGSGERLTDAERGAAHTPEQLAYILYTSGSTGQPKGVLIEHKSVVRLVRGVSYVALGPEERFLLLSPLAFDASTFELWAPLLHGARLGILPPGPFSIELLAETLSREAVTTLWMTAGLFHVMVDELPSCLASVRQLLTGGEAPSGKRIAKLLAQRPDLTVINGYGPTESTTFTTTYAMTQGAKITDPPPLGHPISNTQVYVLNAHLQPQPIGVAGELFIGGDGLARGYLNRPDLTAGAFVPNPLDGTPGSRLYRTGDLARWRSDGTLEFLGRRDEQVKIRGYRIEPGETEAVLRTYGGLQDCAVVVHTKGDKKSLVAYVVPADGEVVDGEVLRQFLKARLPDFMVPPHFVLQERLPLNANGKVDRRALAALPVIASRRAPRVSAAVTSGPKGAQGTRERVLIEIWKDVLGVRQVERTDDFFALGGQSLAALKLIQRLRGAGYGLEVVDLFRHPTVAGLVDVLVPLRPEAVEEARVVADGQPAAGDVLARLQEGVAGHPPLVFLPSNYGDLLIYSNLIGLIDDAIPCLGLQCATMYENDRGIRSMQDLAAWFVEVLRKEQPVGPYYLTGYCFGGLLAMEMAILLQRAGEEIGLLALIDARPYAPASATLAYWRMRLRGALRASRSDWKRHLSAKLAMQREAKLIDALARKSPEKLDKRDLNCWVLGNRVLAGYRSSDAYAGPLTFFYPEQSRYELYGDPSCGWMNLADHVYLLKVPGSHIDMMQPPHVSVLADHLNAVMRKAMEESSQHG